MADMEMVNMANERETEDQIDLHVSAKMVQKTGQCWRVFILMLTWVSLALYIWDCVASAYVYVFWRDKMTYESFARCVVAWLSFTAIGCLLVLLVFYNTLVHTVRAVVQACYSGAQDTSLPCTPPPAVPHKIATMLSYYLFDIPKAIIYIVIMAKYSVIPDEEKDWSRPQSGFMSGSVYDHLYYKIIFDLAKMGVLFFLSVLEFFEIKHKDRQLFFLVINSVGAALHICLLLAGAVLKVIIETS